jgi:hypothetical protein
MIVLRDLIVLPMTQNHNERCLEINVISKCPIFTHSRPERIGKAGMARLSYS